MPSAIGVERVEAARRITRALVRGMLGEGELSSGKPLNEVLDDVDAWYEENEAALAEATVDLAFLLSDRLLGEEPNTTALESALSQLSDEDLVAFQEGRVASLEARLSAARQSRAALIEAAGGLFFQEALGLALRATLPR